MEWFIANHEIIILCTGGVMALFCLAVEFYDDFWVLFGEDENHDK